MNIEEKAARCKVFCIGGPKTGTTSLAQAMSMLKFRHKTWDRNLWIRYKEGDLEAVFRCAEEHDSFDDGPWNNDALYQDLDRRFPGSKFILTEREPASWIRSHERHFSALELELKPYLLWRRRYSEGEKQEKLNRYLARNQAIKAYFSKRPGALLRLDVCGGEGWEQLCAFLGCPAPPEPFPVANVSSKRGKSTRDVWGRIVLGWLRKLKRRQVSSNSRS